jgi:hypothetical protein
MYPEGAHIFSVPRAEKENSWRIERTWRPNLYEDHSGLLTPCLVPKIALCTNVQALHAFMHLHAADICHAHASYLWPCIVLQKYDPISWHALLIPAVYWGLFPLKPVCWLGWLDAASGSSRLANFWLSAMFYYLERIIKFTRKVSWLPGHLLLLDFMLMLNIMLLLNVHITLPGCMPTMILV